jgi:hypothetical protein
MSEELEAQEPLDVVDSEQVETVDDSAEPPKSMDDTLRETLAAIESREEPSEQVSGRTANRLRDEKGRLLPGIKEAEAPVEASEPPVVEPAVPVELQKAGFRKDEAAAIMSAPESARAAILNAINRRYEETARTAEQFKTKAQFGDQMERAIAPFQATIQSLGISADMAVSRLMTADHQLRYGTPTQKQQAISKIAQDYGVDLGQGFDPSNVNPDISHLQAHIQRLEARLQQKEQYESTREQETLNSEIQRFASDPKNKYFEAVRADMAALLQGQIAKDLPDAYERAVYANPQTRAQMLAEQQAAAEEKRRAEQAAKAQEAKRANAVNLPRRGTVSARRPIGTMDETIRETAERLGLIS